jgi:hypothetical protein
MYDKYGNSLVTSAKNYLDKLRYLATNNSADLEALYLYEIIYDMLISTEWYEIEQYKRSHLERFLNELILNNTVLTMLEITANTNYVNVNTSQTDYTWDTIWDDSNTYTIYDLNLLMYPDEMDLDVPL